MKDEKMEMCTCECHRHGMLGGKHLYMLIGTLALVYGIVTWAQVTYMWAPYMAWIVGGIILLVIGFIKKWMHMMRMQKGM